MTRTRTIRLLAAALSAVAIGGVGTTPAVRAQDSSAVAVNTKDDSTVFRFVFAVRRVMGDVVDQTNAAVAYSSCENCQTVAIAFQVLLVYGDPSVVDPTNLALAINYECTLCDTLASAYQFVFGLAGPVRFTAEGQHQINDIRKQLSDLRKSGLTGAEIQQKTDALADQLRQVLATEVVPVGPTEEPGAAPEKTSTTPTETTPPTTTETTPTTTETTPETTSTTPTTTTETTPTTTETTPSP
jgi:putative peptide zinc metalloprotease protein